MRLKLVHRNDALDFLQRGFAVERAPQARAATWSACPWSMATSCKARVGSLSMHRVAEGLGHLEQFVDGSAAGKAGVQALLAAGRRGGIAAFSRSASGTIS